MSALVEVPEEDRGYLSGFHRARVMVVSPLLYVLGIKFGSS